MLFRSVKLTTLKISWPKTSLRLTFIGIPYTSKLIYAVSYTKTYLFNYLVCVNVKSSSPHRIGGTKACKAATIVAKTKAVPA